MFGKHSEPRFETIFEEGGFSGFRIVVDRQTGVNYLINWQGGQQSGGITPLLDKDGKVVVTPTNS